MHLWGVHVMVHWWPCLCVLVNVLFTRCQFDKGDWRIVAVYGAVYLCVNYVGVQVRGEPLYPFLPWNTWKSHGIAVGLYLGGIAEFMGTAWLVNAVKRWQVKGKSE
ncbi:hypothetical protein FGO68_gene16478 [Halteria grandinella]|uniref:Uncharacterized protein n=1 Tax=Halteria grandinella TaxID=5974 RepID=A0A8J8NJJ3_HALGN|nr:hypothetical protein FGO68_gene16478 [Halteria grandinella]